MLHIILHQGNARKTTRVIPGGPVVKNPPPDAWDVDSIPGQETNIPQAAEQLLSLQASTRERPAHFSERCHI